LAATCAALGAAPVASPEDLADRDDLDLENGVVFHLESAWWTPRPRAAAFEVVGTEGRAAVETGGLTVTDRAGATEAIPLAGTDRVAAPLAARPAARRAGAAPPSALADGPRAMAVGEAVLASLGGGPAVATGPYLGTVAGTVA
jgi:predicted dehydrogenase